MTTIMISIISIGYVLWFIAGYKVGQMRKRQEDLINKYLNNK